MLPEAGHDERRHSSRLRVLMHGQILFNKGTTVLNCMIRDLSESGARISFAEALWVPSEVELEIPKTAQWFRAKVVWSNGRNHGLMFTRDALPPRSASAGQHPWVALPTGSVVGEGAGS